MAESPALVCAKCGLPPGQVVSVSFLGFRGWTCEQCRSRNDLPLSATRRRTYWILVAIVGLAAVQYAREGRFLLPGVLGVALLAGIVVALRRDARLRKRHFVTAGGVAGATESGFDRKFIVLIGAAATIAALLFPPWRAEATRTTFTYRQYIGTDTTVDHFEWTIPFASILEPPSDPRLLEAVFTDAATSAQSQSPDALDSIIEEYKEQLKRLEARARIPYHLTVLGLGAAAPDGDYTVRRAKFAFRIDVGRLVLIVLSIAIATGAAWLFAPRRHHAA